MPIYENCKNCKCYNLVIKLEDKGKGEREIFLSIFNIVSYSMA